MAKLAIKGCEFRGNEVIAILKMLGCKNTDKYNGESEWFYYYIDNDGNIECDVDEEIPFPCIYFTLDEFLEKFHYKVGDKVYYDNKVCDVIEMLWNSNLNTISYGVYDGKIKNLAIAEEFKPYKEETMEEIKIDIPKGYEFAGVDDDNQQVVFTKIGYHYPNTYEECFNICFGNKHHIVQVVGLDGLGDNKELFESFIKLKICRDAYWKIAGDWKPEFRFGKKKYCIMTKDNKVISATVEETNRILVFPTEEMRDAFYENFKELIEQCKELL